MTRTCRSWTNHEERRLLALRAAGYTVPHIAEALRRSRCSIEFKLKHLHATRPKRYRRAPDEVLAALAAVRFLLFMARLKRLTAPYSSVRIAARDV